MTQTLASHPHRVPSFPINNIFIHRWSPRSYSDDEIPDQVLFSAFEAARWAPSSQNSQPWRFLYSKRGSVSWNTFVELLNPNNRLWAEKASALVVLISKMNVAGRDGQIRFSRTHSFDSGAAWQNLALQAAELGWPAHPIGGFDRDKARKNLEIPEGYAVEVAIAIGRRGSHEALPPDLQEREKPTPRLPIEKLAYEGGFRES
jgi:nitroreductase